MPINIVYECLATYLFILLILLKPSLTLSLLKINEQIGRLSSAKEDLEQIEALKGEQFVDYHWQRHLLHMLEGQLQLAEDDLWKCRAELFGPMLFGVQSMRWTEKQLSRRERLLQALSRLVQLRGDRRTELNIRMNLVDLRPEMYLYYYQRGKLYQKVGVLSCDLSYLGMCLV